MSGPQQNRSHPDGAYIHLDEPCSAEEWQARYNELVVYAPIIEREGQVFNRIHVEDICRIITAAMAQPRRGRIINLADEKPAPQGDVVRCAAKLLGVAPPEPQTLEEANLSAMARSFYVSRRRVGSRVIKPELGLDLLYPDYESGLAAILAAEGG